MIVQEQLIKCLLLIRPMLSRSDQRVYPGLSTKKRSRANSISRVAGNARQSLLR